MKPTPRFLPVVRFYERPLPSHPPFLYDALAAGMRAQGRVAPGRFTNLSWLYLRDEAQEFDGAPGMPRDFRPAALLLDYSIRWENTTAHGGRMGWINQSEKIPAYATIIANERENLHVEIDEMLDKQNDLVAKKPPEKLSAQDEQQLFDAQSILDELNANGYLRTGYDLMSTGVSGLFWGATLAPARVTSGFTLSRDRAVSFALLRYEAPKELPSITGQHTYTIEIGNGATCYALRIGDDGNSSTFFHFRNMSEKARETLKAQLETVLDRGRLTADDNKQLLEWEAEEQAIRATAKARKEAKETSEEEEKKLAADEALRIDQLRTQADALKDTKRGLTDADENTRRDLENKLYLAQEEFSLIEGARGLLGKAITVTFRFLRSGYIEIATDAGQNARGKWKYENKRITGLKPPRYQSGLPDGCFINLHSTGGKWALVFGHPLHARHGSQWSQAFEIPFLFDPSEIRFDYEADVNMPGCRISAELMELRAPQNGRPGLYQVRVDLFSDYQVSAEDAGKGTPELYSMEMHIAAGPVPAWAAPVWDSLDPTTRYGGVISRVMDVIARQEGERSLACQVHIANPGGAAKLPPSLGGLACDAELTDRHNEDATVPLARKAFVMRNEMPNFKRLATDESGSEIIGTTGHQAQVDVVGVENFLNGEIAACISGHNKLPNDYLRELAFDGGLSASDVLIAAGDIGIKRIDKAVPGTYPSVKPAPDARYWEWMQKVAKDHCPGWELVSTPQGLDLVRTTTRRRPELAYDVPPQVLADSSLCLRGTSKLTQDLRDYVTTVRAIGAVNPLTGMRYTQSETRPEAYRPEFKDSMYYIGRDIPVTLPIDESLTSDVACLLRAREELDRRGKPPWYLPEARIDFEASLRNWDVPTIFGVQFRVESLGFGSLNAGDDRQKMVLSLRLHEDKKLKQLIDE